MTQNCQKIPVVVCRENLEPRRHTNDNNECIRKNRTRIKLYKESLSVSYQYHCPIAGCIFSVNSERSFSCLKYLRQHYHKTHATKQFFCEKCKKGFAKSSELKAHVRSCGSTFACSCGYEYSTRAALLTHAKRKMHILPNEQQTEFRKPQKAKQTASSPVIPCGKPNDFTNSPVIIVLVNNDSNTDSLKSDCSGQCNPIPNSTHSTVQKPRFILPKQSPLDALSSQTIAALALSELSTTTFTRSKISTCVQTDGPIIESVERQKCVHCTESASEKSKLIKNATGKRSAKTQTSSFTVCKKRSKSSSYASNRSTQTCFDETGTLSVSTQTLTSSLNRLSEQAVLQDMYSLNPSYSYGGTNGWSIADSSQYSLANDKFCQTMEDLGVNVNFSLSAAVSSGTQTSPGTGKFPRGVLSADQLLDPSLHCYLGMDNLPTLQDYSMLANEAGTQMLDSCSLNGVQLLSSETQTERSLEALFLANGGDSDDETGIISSNIQTQTSEDLESLSLQQLLLSHMQTQTSDPFLFTDLSGLCDIQTQTSDGDGNPNLVDTHTQTNLNGLLSLATQQIDMETQTLLSLLEGGDSALTDSHTQTSTDILSLLDYCSDSEEP